MLRLRWRLLTRSPRGVQVTVLFLALLVLLGLARLRRPAPQEATLPPVSTDV
jgi:MYXO-CTERM domain-containing protein